MRLAAQLNLGHLR